MDFEHIGPIVERVMDRIVATMSVRAPEPVLLELPAPPSANRWWRRAGNRMHLSHEAEDYKADVARRLNVHGAPHFPTERLTLVMVWRRDRKAGDLDKRLGVLLDALQGSVYASDAQIVQLWARRCDDHPELAPGTVRVEVCATDAV